MTNLALIPQGFRTAEKLASKVVPFFKLCDEQLSSQSHYDFGLRALKNVLISAGNVKRQRTHNIIKSKSERGEEVEEDDIAKNLPEQEILIAVSCCFIDYGGGIVPILTCSAYFVKNFTLNQKFDVLFEISLKFSSLKMSIF